MHGLLHLSTLREHHLVAVVAGAEICACGHRDRTILPHLRDLAMDVMLAA